MRDAAATGLAGAVGRGRAVTPSPEGAQGPKFAEVPVLFENTLAVGLLGRLHCRRSVAARSTATTFYSTSLGQPVLASHVDMHGDPHRARATARHSTTGVVTRARSVVDNGVC